MRAAESVKRFPNTVAYENILGLREHLKAFRIEPLNLKNGLNIPNWNRYCCSLGMIGKDC